MAICLAVLAELPPRARRIHEELVQEEGLEGTTSACAENTQQLGVTDRIQGNYLRVRGEYAIGYASLPITVELPPRARRILAGEAQRRTNQGTTSACAENTFPSRWLPEFAWNYLRVRGEYGTVSELNTSVAELPPRARRIPPVWRVAPYRHGTTSACAENTPTGAR